MTLAQQAAAYIAALGWTVQKVAHFTQVDQSSVRRWLAEAAANDVGTTTGVNVDASRVLHLQALAALQRLAPGLTLRLPSSMPDEWLAEVAGCRPVLAGWEVSREDVKRAAVVRDGAEVRR